MPQFEIPERFQVTEEISADAFEVVMLATDLVLGREVLLKAPGPFISDFLRVTEDRERALREARALARVHSPGVMNLLDVIDVGAGPLLVLEAVAGETLAEKLAREGPLPPDEVRAIGHVLADALESVHRAGILHRGLSTRAVVIRADGSPCLTGFTFAKLDSCSLHTSIDYKQAMPQVPLHPGPEQIDGLTGDVRSDVFGLGSVLYQCLTGRAPAGVPEPVSSLVEDVPERLDRAIMKSISSSPLKRHQSAAEMRDALAPPATKAPATPPAPAKPRHRGLLAVAAVAIVAIVASAGLWGSGVFDRSPAFTGPGPAGDGRTTSSRGLKTDVYRPEYTTSHALLIGIGAAYRGSGFQELPNAEMDVGAIGEQLEAMPWEKWQIRTLAGGDATREAILHELAGLERAAGPDSRVFIYFAGHGMAHERAESSGWIIPADGKRQREDPGRSSWLSFDEFARFFDQTAAKHVLVALDCCYSGRLAAGRSAGTREYAERFLRQKAHVVVTSGRPFEAVTDGVPGDNSPFAKAFIDALRSDDSPAITTSMLWARIDEAFTKAHVTHVPQMRYGPGSVGQFVFFLEE